MDALEIRRLMRDHYLTDWKCEKIIEEISAFEKQLDNEHEIALRFASFGASVTMIVA